jgi:hypothetical protein
MSIDTISEIGLALARGNVALWLGIDWESPSGPEDRDYLRRVDWLGIWSEARRIGFTEVTGGQSTATSSGRMIVEVPNRIDDILGEHFSIAEVCPHFYLNGKGDKPDSLSDRQRRRSRDAKIEQLTRLRSTVLLIAGVTDPQAAREALLRDIYETLPDAPLIVLIGVPDPIKDTIVAGFPNPLADKIVSVEFSLVELLKKVKERRQRLPERPSIRIGTLSVPLVGFLRSEPPLDQDFIIVTEQHVREAEPDEPEDRLLVELLSGTQPPWRAMAHNIQWDRALPHRDEVRRQLHRLERGGPQVVCLNIPASPGAGLTVLLQEIAFDCGRAHFPTFIHRADNGMFNYDVLRTFLTDVYVQTGHANELQHVPAVLIFDAHSVEADTQGILQALPNRLARDGRRALIIRGIAVRGVADLNVDFKKLHEVRPRKDSIHEDWLPFISSSLDSSQQSSLLEWAQLRFERLGQAMPPQSAHLIYNWDQQQPDVPLLICLYSILKGELRDAARLGRHLIQRLRNNLELSGVASPAMPPAGSEPLSGVVLQEAIARLRVTFGRLAKDDYTPSVDDVASTFIVLAAFGCLRIKSPRNVLSDVARVDRNTVHRTIALLEKCDLASTDLPHDADPRAVRTDTPLAPAAFYTVDESVGLRHPAYGRLIFDWLSQPDAADDLRFLNAGGLTGEVLAGLDQTATIDDYPLGLLRPIFQSLKPNQAHVRFAEDLSMRYLRLQKGRHHEALTAWQWSNYDLIIRAFSWLPEQVVRQSASILHSRGITSYKTCRLNVSLADCRKRYQAAEADFGRAIDLARKGGSERPVNILTSLGLLYLGWADRERAEGNEAEWRALDRKVEDTLRGALQEHPSDNPFAVFGLARYLVSRYQRIRQTASANASALSGAAQDLAEAVELLQGEPESYFEDEWDRLWTEVVGLLTDADAESLIEILRSRRDELAYALAALRALTGWIPTGPTNEPAEVGDIRRAAEILHQASTTQLDKRCNLAQLLRYAVFSADPDRFLQPAFQTRYDLIAPLIGSRYLDQPVWLFDYAMLAFQVGQYAEGADAFSRLRKGQRFFEVSRDRGCPLTESPDSPNPRKVSLRVVSTEGSDAKGWGRVEYPIRFRDPVPFSVRAFTSRNKRVNVGTTVMCFIRLNPAGPFAEPQ